MTRKCKKDSCTMEKVQGFEQHTCRMYATSHIGASLYDRKRMLDEEFPVRAKELNDKEKERRKKRSATS